jgi:hypothetical protein
MLTPPPAIYGQDFLAPRSAALDQLGITLSDTELPALRQASDILAAFWLRGPNPRNLRYWFGNDIVNTETVPVINKILVDKGYNEVPQWPGLQVDAPSDEYLALLGTPVGASKAFFLIQHKVELRIKNIPSITIFRDAQIDSALEYELLFRIEDVPQDEIAPDDMEVVDEGMTGVATRQRRMKRSDSLVGLDLGRNVARLHKTSVDEEGETVLYSHDLERDL